MGWEERFGDYIERLGDVLGHADRRGPLRAYATGLLLPGERKSVEPMAARVEPFRVGAAHQSLHHFVAKAAWDDAALLAAVRAYALPALENVALWHERDISHSSVERMIGPDATVTLDFMLARLTGVVDKLLVYPENMRRNLDRLGGLVHSQRVLLALTQKGVSREDAYRLVQRNAMPVWRGEGDFLTLLKGDTDVTGYLSPAEIETCFDLGYHFKHVDTIFSRVFGAS